MSSESSTAAAPVMAAHVVGSGPPLVMLHGGFGCWKHWVRNVGPLSEHFTVHAVDLPSYGASAPVPRETTGEEYLELVHDEFIKRFGNSEVLRLVGFSFGGAISTYLAGRLKQRVSHLALKSPAGFPPQPDGIRNRMSYKAARGDEEAMRTAIRFNLLQNMLFYPDSLDEEAMTIQRYCVDNTRFDSRKISGGGLLFDNLKKTTCPVIVLWGEKDDFDFRPADPMIADMLAAKSDIEVHRIPKAGHWSAYENAPVVNRSLIDFMTSER